MNHWLMTSLLLADGGRAADQFVKGFREGTLHRTTNYDWVMYAVAGLVVVLAYYVFDRFWRNRAPSSQPNERRLFQDLCRAHALDRASVRLLQRIARRAKVSQLPEVFLRPELFQGQSAFSRRDQSRIDRLRAQLFGA
jgi:hypothetical protein